MIRSKAEYRFYLLCDEIARFGRQASRLDKLKAGCLWAYNRNLRRLEYYTNCRRDIIGRICRIYYKYRVRATGYKLGWCLAPNVFGPGLCIVHPGTVVVNRNVRFGCNSRLHTCVNIGANSGDPAAPMLGDNVYVGPGAKIFGNIIIGSDIAIGANAVVNRSFTENGVTIAGAPARIISDKGSKKLIIDAVKAAEKISPKYAYAYKSICEGAGK